MQKSETSFYSEVSKTNAAVLSAEVRRYSTNDEEKTLTQTHISLEEHKVLQENPSGLNVIRRTFEFVEKTYSERIIQLRSFLKLLEKLLNNSVVGIDLAHESEFCRTILIEHPQLD